MSSNEDLIRRFYEAFAARDAEGMASCYDDAAAFSDPVFVDLRGERVRHMWRMLCERGKDLRVVHSGIVADAATGSARWEAFYTFSATGRRVHNVIDARFKFASGRIVEHVDTFDLWRWAGMALGLKGRLLGWTPLVQNAIRRQASRGLDGWIAKRQSGQPGAANA